MDYIKIEKFIAVCRKEINLTQIQLAKKLNVTNTTISKWENNRNFVDASLYHDLCRELDITINELLASEYIASNDNEQYFDKNIYNFNKTTRKNKIIFLFLV